MNVKNQEIYSEVYNILTMMGNEYISKLPKKLYKMIEKEKSSTYNPQYTSQKSLNEQNVKRETLAMIALFHLNYWCNSGAEKTQLQKLFKDNEDKYQAQLREKYNPDDIFQKSENIEEKTTNEIMPVENKETFLTKTMQKIKKIFNKLGKNKN